MITFVTSLRHPATATDYPLVERLLDATLRSLHAQTDPRFEVVVVANTRYRPPADLGFAVRSLVVGFEPPPATDTKAELHRVIRLDKGAKLAVAISVVEQGHVMMLDADDFVSRRLVAFANGRPDAPGWYVARGVRYDVGQGLVAPQHRFNDVCGSSLLWRRDLLPAPGPMPDASVAELVTAFGREVIVDELGSHQALRSRYGLAPLPFPGAVYAVNHGHNHTPGGGGLAFGVPMPRRWAAEYGVTRPPVRQMWSAALRQLHPRQWPTLAAAGRAVVWNYRRARGDAPTGD